MSHWRWRKWRSLSLLLLLALAAACQAPSPTSVAQGNGARPTATAAATAVAPGPTASPTATISPSPTLPALATATATATALPTPTLPPTPTPCASPGEVVTGAFVSSTSGQPHRYRIYLPPCYAADGNSYPTLYLFSGNIHDESKWDELGIDEAADAAIAAGEIPPLLIVMPDGGWLANNTSGGPGSYESLVLQDLLPHVEATYCSWADPDGRAVGGLSRGGYWALEIAFRFPDLFASVGGHSAALMDQFAGPDVNPQYTALGNDLGDLRIYLDIGADDHVRANTVRLHQDMEAAGITHDWLLQEGRHDDAYWTSHLADYLRWYSAPWSMERESYPPCHATAPSS